jgi:hypothetical protein
MNRGKTKRNVTESFDGYSNDALTDMIVNLSRYEGNEEDIQNVKKELNKRKGIAEDVVGSDDGVEYGVEDEKFAEIMPKLQPQ